MDKTLLPIKTADSLTDNLLGIVLHHLLTVQFTAHISHKLLITAGWAFVLLQ